uniref:ATP synthase F0 subunit 8 n=1 Tax=Changbaninus pleiospicules TaxID=2914790 RepID=UPI001EF9F336|nr:ATP synthase F0 subunit 8 [Changbaninus pleiospicules]UKE80316.1 ATP synthase F0 subunit 8 [Changbaninus pleiospicules]
MPQMAPMWWTIIMLMTMSTLMITVIINYFNSYMIVKGTLKTKTNKMNWVW